MAMKKCACFVTSVIGLTATLGIPACCIVSAEQAGQKPEPRLLEIKASTKLPDILKGHLKMGAPVNPDGQTYGVNSLYFTRDGWPWLPVMGEIHYARLPHEQWEEAVLAMKAGGIEIVATYVFWIFHEELQGRYDWYGDRDLRRFLEICHKHDMPVWLRIGPWCHGEARNGGFPDWLSKVCKPRSMDPAYFDQVRRWYAAVAEQTQGLYHKDGGPIIGIQFDNEFGHAGGRGGDPYILECKEIALELGMDVPYYSVTGWGWAWVPQDEVLPVQGSYVDYFWARGTDRLPPFDELLFSDLMSLVLNTDISDMVTNRLKQERLRYDPSRYPYATAELGGGMHHKWPRRPVLDSKDTEAMALCRLGEGANMIGYYVYHGGSQPLGKTGRLGEEGMPLVSYDYQAPLQEYGKTNRSYYALKRLHLFVQDFGRDLAQMVPSLPEDRPAAADPTKLRYALRSKDTQGYLFFNDYQRYLEMPDRRNVQFAVTLADHELVFPAEPITIPSRSLGVFPINMPIADANLAYASAQPMMLWQDGDVTRLVMVNLTGIEPQFCLKGVKKPVTRIGKVRRHGDTWLVMAERAGIVGLTTNNSARVEVLLISEADSLNAWDIRLAGRRHLAICPHELWQSGDFLQFRTRQSGPVQLRVYPATDLVITKKDGRIAPRDRNGMCAYTLPGIPLPQVAVESQPDAQVPPGDEEYPFRSTDAPPRAWRIRLGDIDWKEVSDVFVRFECIGDSARLYLNSLLVADNLWCKTDWEIALKRWQKQLTQSDAELILVISPWKKGQKVFVQEPPNVADELTAELLSVSASTERTFTFEVAGR